MARSFNGTSDYIDLSIGGMASVAAPFTCMAIVNRSAVGSRAFASINSGTTRRSEFKFNGSSVLRWTLPTVNDADVAGTAVLDTSGWAVVGISKASGSAAPRGHRYLYSGGAWVHANSVTSMANPTAGTSIRIGAIATPADYWAGDIAVVGFWNRVLTDTETETLTTALSSWLALTPAVLLPFNQASTATAVTDVSSTGTASQTAISGTTVAASDPPGFSYSLGGPTTVITTDTGALTDSSAISVTESSTDSGALADASIVAAAAGASTDSAALADSSTVTATETSTDAASVIDASTLAATGASADSGTLTDTSTLAATRAATDAGTFTDTSTTPVVGGNNLASADAAALVDNSSDLLITDTVNEGTFGEASILTAAAANSDSGAFTDIAELFAARATADVATLSESSIRVMSAGMRNIQITGVTEPTTAWQTTDLITGWASTDPNTTWGTTEPAGLWTHTEPAILQAWTTTEPTSAISTTEPTLTYATTEPSL